MHLPPAGGIDRAGLKLISTPFKCGLGLAMLLALVVAVYAPGLNGPFILDDRENITAVPTMKMSALN